MGIHSAEDMQVIAERVFVTRESTLEAEAADHSVDDLKQTVRVVRRMFRTSAATIAAHAYDAQPDDAGGNEVWSAGEIVSHIAGSMIWTDRNIRQIIGLEETSPDPELARFTEIKVRSREESLAALDAADEELTRILDMIPANHDAGRTIDHERFGTIGVKGWLLLTALHEADHTRQLQSLAADQ